MAASLTTAMTVGPPEPIREKLVRVARVNINLTRCVATTGTVAGNALKSGAKTIAMARASERARAVKREREMFSPQEWKRKRRRPAGGTRVEIEMGREGQ